MRLLTHLLMLLSLELVPLGSGSPQSSLQDIEVVDIAFADGIHGWVSVVGPSPALFRTADGGISWDRISLASSGGFYRLYFYDAKTGIALQAESEKSVAIYRTVDAGRTWVRVNSIDLLHGEVLLGVYMTTPHDAVVVGESEMPGGFVAQLSDDGRTLRVCQRLPPDLSEEANPYGVFGDGMGHLWVVGKELILHSSDNGRTWENQYLNSAPRIEMGMSGAAVAGGHAWIAVANFEIYKTEDYGKHWIRSLTTSGSGNVNFESVSFRDDHRGCAVGNSSFIYCTSDGGSTWSKSRVFGIYPTDASFNSKLLLFHSSKGWATVSGGLYKTEDGGQSFREVLTATNPPDSDIPGESQALRTSINGPTQLAWDSRGFLFIVESMQGLLLRLDVRHQSIRAMLPEPEGTVYGEFDFPKAIAADRNGDIWIADFNGRLRRLNPLSGDTVVLLDSPPDVSKRPLEEPQAMAVDGQGDLLIVDRLRRLLRWRVATSKLEAVPRIVSGGTAGDGQPATEMPWRFVQGVAVNRSGDIFLADHDNCRILRMDANTQSVTTIAGTGECASKGDGGLAIHAAVIFPSSMAVDGAGNVFLAEGGADRVRRIDARGIITTYAGTGKKGFSGDGGPAEKATLNNPAGVAVDSEGNLYISEYVNNRIRRVDALTHVITTVAGNGKPIRTIIEM